MTESVATPDNSNFPSGSELFPRLRGYAPAAEVAKQREAYEGLLNAHVADRELIAELRAKLETSNAERTGHERLAEAYNRQSTALFNVVVDANKLGKVLSDLKHLMPDAEFTVQAHRTSTYDSREGLNITLTNRHGKFNLPGGERRRSKVLLVTPADATRTPFEITLAEGHIPPQDFLILQAQLKLDVDGQLPERVARVYRHETIAASNGALPASEQALLDYEAKVCPVHGDGSGVDMANLLTILAMLEGEGPLI